MDRVCTLCGNVPFYLRKCRQKYRSKTHRPYSRPGGREYIHRCRNIRSLKVADLRRAISVLFQDYTHFPLSVSLSGTKLPLYLIFWDTKISENIGLGDPENANDEDKIREAARLGGAEEFIDLLPDGFEAFLDRPVQDYYSDLPEGTKTLFGRSVEYSRIRGLAPHVSYQQHNSQRRSNATARLVCTSHVVVHGLRKLTL